MALPAALRVLLDRPEPDRRLGPFLLVHQLGRGGFAPVWLAREVYGSVEIRRVAIKLFAFDDELDGAPSSLSRARLRVIEEARLLCQVEHPNIVRFYRLLEDDEPGVLGLVMEHVDGPSLEQRLRKQGRLSLDEALGTGAAVASALAAVHRAGLVHRDVKPANIVEAQGITKLIDFGIASLRRRGLRAADADAPPLSGRRSFPDLGLEVLGASLSTLAASIEIRGVSGTDALGLPSGTVGYIDPVCVAEGVPATPASDLYALGATLFQCLTGTLPSVAAAGPGGGLKGEVLDGRAHAPALGSILPGAPAGLCRLVDALLAPERAARPASAERVALELSQLQAEREGRARRLPPEEVGPFRGLGRFVGADRDVYFGRTAEVASALTLLRGRGLVAMVGPSGSGKSSLARAGVAPAVADGGLGGWIKAWDVRVAVPGADPRASLGAALTELLGGKERVERVERLAPEAIVDALARRAEAEGRGALLVVDQLEELVTLADEPGRAWAAALLSRIAEPTTPGVRALVAARRDLLDPLLSLPRLGRVLERGFLLVAPLSEVVWAEVIDQALAAYGYRFEDEALRREVMDEIAKTATAMPLVQFALTELWKERDRERKLIPRAGLHAVGGVAGALDRYAEATLQKLKERFPDAEAATRELLLELTTPQGTRGMCPLSELTERTRTRLAVALVSALEEARLLSREEGGITLAHEALLTQWRRLRDWVAAARDDRVLAEDLERDAARWAHALDESLLWRGRRLLAGEELLKLGLLRLSPIAESFVRRARAVERRARWIQRAIGVLVMALVCMAAYSYNSKKDTAMSRLRDSNEELRKALRYKEKELQDLRERPQQPPPPFPAPWLAPAASAPSAPPSASAAAPAAPPSASAPDRASRCAPGDPLCWE